MGFILIIPLRETPWVLIFSRFQFLFFLILLVAWHPQFTVPAYTTFEDNTQERVNLY